VGDPNGTTGSGLEEVSGVASGMTEGFLVWVGDTIADIEGVV